MTMIATMMFPVVMYMVVMMMHCCKMNDEIHDGNDHDEDKDRGVWIYINPPEDSGSQMRRKGNL